ncbi:MAG: hypothetical protein J07HQW1_01963 [Haloquadratum walsbyi J07HQW1]|uniref:Uncharacterized protein n=1 Tax=Haloquadratum walsbyi J07HQW1 TaxID=1238424 RepID=U1MPQ2_9EURY|nr:MAG: hypothetical protein J07HQW1_01963 [Haloquadratum walsbyi J07HQW1]
MPCRTDAITTGLYQNRRKRRGLMYPMRWLTEENFSKFEYKNVIQIIF